MARQKMNQTWRTPAPIIYRGYLIESDFSKTLWFAKRDGFTISTSPSIEAAKASIDAVVGEATR